ncbi:two-component system response regulator [candidate division KSB3 bacterium]|uniref:Two-component system response regulator n=1 Tax=candidate division KSB3 bacterium TaxID=2044937 RepID=A0A2G6K6J0_9BACT|nr:MAG: two-component system response regulator [candidate division KSB3 bacterium]
MNATSPPFPILLVDDEIHALQGYKIHLLGEGIRNVLCCQHGQKAVDILASQDVSVMLLDLRMPGLSGEEVLDIASERHPHIPVIVLTAVNDVETAVRCMKAGAFDYLTKPIAQTRLITTIKRALEFRELRRENTLLKQHVLDGELKHPDAFFDMITQNEQMRSLFRYMESIAGTAQPVLITGETGTGKELIARAIHRLSACQGELVTINVAGLDDTAFSDSLFGHTCGAFTGADRERPGLLQQAAGGTILLDEIGDLVLQSQIKLLRLLQEREYYPLGADRPKRTDARVVAATNCNLPDLQQSGAFRQDLYYRLMLHHVHIPPLRERREDIPLLVQHFLEKTAEALDKAIPTPPPELFQLLAVYNFPGNIRELEAMVFDAVSRHEKGILSLSSFQHVIQHHEPLSLPDTMPEELDITQLYHSLQRLPSLKEAEEVLMREALERSDGNHRLAAMLLGITRQTLYNRLHAKKSSA